MVFQVLYHTDPTPEYTNPQTVTILYYYYLLIYLFLILGHVGPPLVCNIIKLDDVEEMNYFSSNNEGEVGTDSCVHQKILKHSIW